MCRRDSRIAASGRRSGQVAEELFEGRVCRTCHEITQQDGPDGVQWGVAEVRQNHRWMPQARFDHKSHAQSKCADCHDVAKSKRSADVAMPTIEGCRECHGGCCTPGEKGPPTFPVSYTHLTRPTHETA